MRDMPILIVDDFIYQEIKRLYPGKEDVRMLLIKTIRFDYIGTRYFQETLEYRHW